MNEMFMLQGMDPKKFKIAVPEAEMGKQIGNAMSVNVIQRILTEALPAAGLVDKKPTDTWKSDSHIFGIKRTG